MQWAEIIAHREDYILKQSCDFVAVKIANNSVVWDFLSQYIDTFPHNSTFQEQ